MSTEQLTVAAMTKASLRTGALRASVQVWAALVIFTSASFLLGGEHLLDDKTVAAAVVVGIAAVKIRLIGMHFMELRHAPPALRACFEVYCALLFIVITAIYLVV